jgi:hypothetical protein
VAIRSYEDGGINKGFAPSCGAHASLSLIDQRDAQFNPRDRNAQELEDIEFKEQVNQSIRNTYRHKGPNNTHARNGNIGADEEHTHLAAG